MIYVFIIISLIIFVIWLKKFHSHNDYIVNLCSGVNGGGKTFNNTLSALKSYRCSLKRWSLINKPTIFQKIIHLYFLPYFNNKRKNDYYFESPKPLLYSNYPILIKKGVLSEPLTREIMLLESAIPWGSIIVLDEVSKWVNQFEFKESFSKTLDEHISYFRHYHGDFSRLYLSDQCSNLIPCQIRYRVNQSVYYIKTKHYLKFIHISYYRIISLTDDIKSIQDLDNTKSLDDLYLKKVSFSWSKKYDSLAYSNFYCLYDSTGDIVKYHNSPLKCSQLLFKPIKNKKYKCVDDLLFERGDINEKID